MAIASRRPGPISNRDRRKSPSCHGFARVPVANRVGERARRTCGQRGPEARAHSSLQTLLLKMMKLITCCGRGAATAPCGLPEWPDISGVIIRALCLPNCGGAFRSLQCRRSRFSCISSLQPGCCSKGRDGPYRAQSSPGTGFGRQGWRSHGPALRAGWRLQ